MSRLDEARQVLAALGVPERQQNDVAVYTLLAFAGLDPSTPWRDASAQRLNPHRVIEFARDRYGKTYAENTRETIRRQVIHQFIQAGILSRNPDDPGLPTNSPKTHYALTDEALRVVRSFEDESFPALAEEFVAATEGGLAAKYARRREMRRVPVTLPSGDAVTLSPGQHNELQRAVVEQLLERFAPGAVLLYLGDTETKNLIIDEDTLHDLGVTFDSHNKLPDVVAFDAERNWLWLIEAVTSHGPVSPKRHEELEQMLSESEAHRVYVSAFLDFQEYKRHASEIAWETEVWIAEAPTHLLHYDGEHFLSPHGGG